jgi:hypothetical protein
VHQAGKETINVFDLTEKKQAHHAPGVKESDLSLHIPADWHSNAPNWMRYPERNVDLHKALKRQSEWLKPIMQVVAGFGVLVTVYIILSFSEYIDGGDRLLPDASGIWKPGSTAMQNDLLHAEGSMVRKVAIWLESLPENDSGSAETGLVHCAVDNVAEHICGTAAPRQLEVLEIRMVSREGNEARIAVQGIVNSEHQPVQAFSCQLTVLQTDTCLLVQRID